jgi:hypothetical protein
MFTPGRSLGVMGPCRPSPGFGDLELSSVNRGGPRSRNRQTASAPPCTSRDDEEPRNGVFKRGGAAY